MNLLRTLRFAWQRLTRGWSDRDTWNLDTTIAEFVYPRLKRFKEVNNGYPGSLTVEEWDNLLDDMIYAFGTSREIHSADRDWERVDRGLRAFAEWYFHLWW